MTERELMERAAAARKHAYAPYSAYLVGAALLTASGKVFTGCNIENASFGATICAERVAAAKAVSAGERRFTALAVAADAPEPPAPCGLCRQFLIEFARDLVIYTTNLRGDFRAIRLGDLLPEAFTRDSLARIPANAKTDTGAGGA